MTVCAIFGCKNYRRKTKGTHIKYYRFPKDLKYVKIWEQACRRADKINILHARICSEHFTKDCEYISLQQQLLGYSTITGRKIKSDAIPTLNLPGAQENKNATTSLKLPRNNKCAGQVSRRRFKVFALPENSCNVENQNSESGAEMAIDTDKVTKVSSNSCRHGQKLQNITQNTKRKKRSICAPKVSPVPKKAKKITDNSCIQDKKCQVKTPDGQMVKRLISDQKITSEPDQVTKLDVNRPIQDNNLQVKTRVKTKRSISDQKMDLQPNQATVPASSISENQNLQVSTQDHINNERFITGQKITPKLEQEKKLDVNSPIQDDNLQVKNHVKTERSISDQKMDLQPNQATVPASSLSQNQNLQVNTQDQINNKRFAISTQNMHSLLSHAIKVSAPILLHLATQTVNTSKATTNERLSFDKKSSILAHPIEMPSSNPTDQLKPQVTSQSTTENIRLSKSSDTDLISRLYGRIANLEEEVAFLTTKNKKLEIEIDRIKVDKEKEKINADKEIYKLKCAQRAIPYNLSSIFTPGQIRWLLSPTKSFVRWNEEDINAAISLKNVSAAAYKFLRYEWNYPFPGLSTLRKWKCQKALKISPNLLERKGNPLKTKSNEPSVDEQPTTIVSVIS